MRLFRRKEKQSLAWLTTQFSQYHNATIRNVINSMATLIDGDKDIREDRKIIDGIYVWHDALVVASQTTILDKAREERASELLWAYEQALVVTGDVTMRFEVYTKAVSDAYTTYIEAYKTVAQHGMSIPSLRLVRAIQGLSDINLSMEKLVLYLPGIEQYVLESYQKFWSSKL